VAEPAVVAVPAVVIPEEEEELAFPAVAELASLVDAAAVAILAVAVAAAVEVATAAVAVVAHRAYPAPFFMTLSFSALMK